MRLYSDSFVDGGSMSDRHAFGKPSSERRVVLADNRNPHLAWDDVPDATRSFALVLHDFDVPNSSDDVNREGRVVAADLPRVEFIHWVLFDLPAAARVIDDGSFSNGVTPRGKHGPMIAHAPFDGALHGLNDYTGWFAGDARMAGDYYGYDGPCPPWNDSLVHRYVFTLYALSIERLVVTGRVTGAAVRAAMAGSVLAEATLTGLYSLNLALGATTSGNIAGSGEARSAARSDES